MRTLKITDTAGNNFYIDTEGAYPQQILKNYLFDKNDYHKTLKLHFFTSHGAMLQYAEENNLSMYKMATYCGVGNQGNSRDNHVYKITA